MKRFITYIYEYKNGQKCSNTGFMKVDWRKEQCRLEVHIRNLAVKQESVIGYWVVKRNQKTTGIFMGEIGVAQGKGDSQIIFSRQDGNLDFEMEDVIGIAIKGSQTGYLATSWVDDPGIEFLYGTFALGMEKGSEKSEENSKADTENEVKAAEIHTQQMERMAEPRPQPQPEPIPRPYPGGLTAPEPEQMPMLEQTPVPGPPKRPIPGQAPIQIPRPGNPPAEQSGQRPDEIWWNEPWFIPGNEPERSPMPDCPPCSMEPEPMPEAPGESRENDSLESQEAFSRINQSCQEARRHDEDQNNSNMRRIDINDIRTLPSANWYLCNNSFLIHGFFNYKYLVIKEIEENGRKKSYLGVPGIFERPERTMALLFGFPKFEPEVSALQGNANIPVMTVSEEIQDIPEGTFGYWFCLLDI